MNRRRQSRQRIWNSTVGYVMTGARMQNSSDHVNARYTLLMNYYFLILINNVTFFQI